MIKFKYNFLILILLASCSNKSIVTSNENISPESSNFASVRDTLQLNHNWKTFHLGPFGQVYRLDIDTNNKSFIGLHPIIKKKFGGQKKTYVCDLFEVGRKIIIKNNDLVSTNYSSIKGEKVRNTYLLTGKNLTPEEWKLSDQYSWLTYIKEGTGSSYYKQNIFNKTMSITKCDTFTLTVEFKNNNIVFPHMILTIPEYVYLEKKDIKFSKNEDTNKLLEEYKNLAKTAGESIAKGLVYLADEKKMSNKQALSWWNKIFKGPKRVSNKNILFIGELCKLSTKHCGEMILVLDGVDDPNIIIDYWYAAIKNRNK